MKGFRYKHGDRPLEGYTIQRAAGKGGFGEVYYAVSDSGREVALKVIYGYEQIELRGVSQCMNLKSPHLVSIFDVRHNDEGLPFVIMEYVAGPSLRGLLDESPGGLGTQKSAFFLREIGKGLSYLHECGIVHRDLKPGNIFYENGYVKIGDYGLSKAMSASQHSGQTITVGTVHYMAPEIGAGKYDKGIDIYALGACLYEMLTGTVPYLGGSPGEILMKHLSAEPDVSRIEEPFATVIKKAMAKNPTERYQSVQEMIEAVFGAEHVRESVSCFAPESLSMIAQRVAERVAVGAGAGSRTPPPIPPSPRRDRGADVWEQMGNWVDRAGDRMAQLGDRVANNQWWPASERMQEEAGTSPAKPAAASHDPLTKRQRRVLALIVLGVMTVAAGILGAAAGAPDSTWFNTLVTTAALSGGVLLARHKLLPQLTREGAFVQRLAIGGMAAVFMLIFGGMFLPLGDEGRDGMERLAFSGLAALVPLFILDWVRVMEPDRLQRVILGHVFGVGAIAFVVALISPGFVPVAIALAAGTSLLVQVLSPWNNPMGATARHEGRGFASVMREVVNAGADAGPEAPTTPMRAWWQKKASSSHETGATDAAIAAPAHAPAVATTPEPRHAIRRVPRFVRYLWLALTMISLPLGIMLLVFPNVERVNPEEFALFVSFGVGQLFLAVASFLKSFQTRFHGWWRYLVKPLILFLCVQSVLVSAIMLGNANLRGDEAMLATFFIVFPAVVFLVLVFAALFRVDDEPAAAVVHTSTFTTPAGIGAPAAAAGEVQGAAMHGSAEAMTAAMPVRATTAVSVGSLSQYVPSPTTLVHSTVAFLGWMMLLAGTLLGLATAIDMPGLVMLDARGEDYGGPTAGMVRIFMGLGTFVTMLIACGLLMGSRRPHGVAHVLRALLAVVVSGGCIFFVYGTFAANGGLRASEQRAAGVPWSQIGRPSVLQNPVFPRPNREAVIEQYIEDMRTPFLVPAGLCAVAAATLLTWPARRQGLTVETGRTSNA